MLFLLHQREKFLSCLATECVGVLELEYPQYNIMSEKKNKGGKPFKAKNSRRWTDLEIKPFLTSPLSAQTFSRLQAFLCVKGTDLKIIFLILFYDFSFAASLIYGFFIPV